LAYHLLRIAVTVGVLGFLCKIYASPQEVRVTGVVDVKRFLFVPVNLFGIGVFGAVEELHLFDRCPIVEIFQEKTFFIVLFVDNFVLYADEHLYFSHFEYVLYLVVFD
jgi:hypothetical protein